MTEASRPGARPLSPHLQIYRWPVTMAMSILHRITGVGLYGGMLLVAWWLFAVASGPEAYDLFTRIAGSWFGLLVLFGFTWALTHHALGGVRHFVWDVGAGFSKPARDGLAWATAGGSLVLTALTWAVVLMLR